MDREDAVRSIQYLKTLKVTTPKAYKHMGKVLEYLLARIEEAPAPSVYYPSEQGVQDDWVEEAVVEQTLEYEDYSPPEPPPAVDPALDEGLEQSFVEDAYVPLVMGSVASLTPFPVAEEEQGGAAASGEPETPVPQDQEAASTGGGLGGEGGSGESGPETRTKPKRLKIVEPTSRKTSLHTDALKSMKAALRKSKTDAKTKSKKKEVEDNPESK
jgi:hypothetical protein